MDAQTRMHANALLDQLLADDETTFPVKTAQELIDIIPSKERKRAFSLSIQQDNEQSVTGYAEGIGNVNFTEEKKKEIELASFGKKGGQFILWRIGGYKVIHTPGEIKIYHMWDGDFSRPNLSTHALLSYIHKTKMPKNLYLSYVDKKNLRLFGITLTVGNIISYRKWKTPSIE